MKKLLTFLTLLTLSIGVTWADTKTLSWDGNGTSDATQALAANTILNTNGGAYYTGDAGFACNSATKVYCASYGNGLKLGTGSDVGKLTFTISGSIKPTKITVSAKKYGSDTGEVKITVGNNSTQASPGSNDFTDVVFDMDGNNTLTSFSVATTSKRAYIKSITITYGSGSTGTVATPTFSPAEGTFTEAQNVTISCATSGATIHYTTDGSTPTASSTTYSSAIAVSETTTIKAIAVKDGMNNSQVASATYTIETPQPSTNTVYERVTSISASDVGKEFVFVCENKTAAMGAISSYGESIGVSNLTNGTLTLTDEAVVPFTLGGSNGAWTFENNGSYISWSSGNSLSTASSVSNSSQWAVSFSGNDASITNVGTTSRKLQYNASSPRFACYTSSQTAIQLYKKVEATPQTNEVYIVGQINGHDSDPWVSTEGVQLTYNSTNDNYGADIYCTGMKNGNDDGYSYFLFAKSLPFSWDNTGNLYGSGADGSYWPISGLSGESAFDEEIPLYEGSKNVYRLPAGLYTVTVDLDYTHEYTTKSVKVTKRDVTLNVTNSATFETTKNVTMTSNLTELGGKIYYTTNGNDPRDQYSGRQEYTEQLTLDATTTIKAVAVLGCIYSDVVEKTYTKKPAAPEISPASCTFNEPLTVTITAESGATIYYTTDGSDPSDQSTQYTGPFTVSTTTTVKAIAYVGEAYSNIASATYTYSNVQPSTGDFVLVTSADQLVAGNEYIIMSSYEDDWEDVNNVAFGSISSSSGTSLSSGFTVNGNIGTSGSTVSLADGSGVNVLTLGGTTGSWNLKQNDDKYIVLPASDTKLSTNTSACPLVITIGNDYAANIQNSATTDTRQLRYYITSDYFRNYLTSQGKTEDVYLYTRATNSVQPPVFSPIAGIYNVDIDVTISCATDGATIYYTTDGTEPSATNGTEYTGEIIVSESTTFKAIAIKGENSSSVVTAAYTIQKSTNIETVTLDYREPFTAGIGKFFITNNTGFSPVWTLDGNFGVKGTSYEPATGTNHAATSRLVSPIIDMTDAVQPDLTFSHQINSFFNDVTTQATLWIRETTNGTSGTWTQLPITFSDPVAAGGWTNDVVDIDLSDYAGKKVQISFLYTNPTAGSGAGTWEIQNFVVADNSEYRMVNNIAEFLALENGTKAKFKNPVTVLYDYAQRGDQEYIWVKDGSGYMQFFLQPTLNSSTESTLDPKAAYYENGDIIPAGFVVVKNYYENGKYVQAYSTEALDAGFEPATQKGLADPDHYEFSTLNALTLSDADIAANCNRYITVEKVKIASKSGKNFTFANENGTVNACVGYNKYNGDGSLLKDGTTTANVTVPAVSNTYYNVKGIIQIWQGGWELMPIEFTEWKADEVTLRKLCADGEVNGEYIISNNLMGVYASEDGTKLWVKDDTGQSIWPDAPDATYKDNFPINAEGNSRLDQALYDQSNWCEIQLTSENAGDFVGKIIKGGSIDGTFSNKTNPTMTGVTLTNDNIYSDGSYEPNYYIPCNFYGNQSCQTSQHGQPGHGDYFFMTPKPQEYAMVVWAIWDSENEQFVVNENPQYNSHGFQGSFKVDLSLNQNPNIALHDGMDDNFAYNFSAIIRVNSSKAGNDFMVYPLNLSAATDPATAIESVVAGNGEVKSVKFYNVAGIESATPFQGVNIVVTEYTDGSRTTTKMLRK